MADSIMSLDALAYIYKEGREIDRFFDDLVVKTIARPTPTRRRGALLRGLDLGKPI